MIPKITNQKIFFQNIFQNTFIFFLHYKIIIK